MHRRWCEHGQQHARRRRTLTYASGDAEPTCLDPHVGGNYPQALLATQYIEELVGLEDGKTTPELATEWTTSDDGRP